MLQPSTEPSRPENGARDPLRIDTGHLAVKHAWFGKMHQD